MTALHVIIGELMPKSIALQRAEVTALWIGRPMSFFAAIFSPLIWLLNGIGNFLLRLLGGPRPSREETLEFLRRLVTHAG